MNYEGTKGLGPFPGHELNEKGLNAPVLAYHNV
jgi:hypothetical protein